MVKDLKTQAAVALPYFSQVRTMADLLTASSPKFNEKKKIPAAEEKAYNNIAPCIRR
jgi:hypothetical protein